MHRLGSASKGLGSKGTRTGRKWPGCPQLVAISCPGCLTLFPPAQPAWAPWLFGHRHAPPPLPHLPLPREEARRTSHSSSPGPASEHTGAERSSAASPLTRQLGPQSCGHHEGRGGSSGCCHPPGSPAARWVGLTRLQPAFCLPDPGEVLESTGPDEGRGRAPRPDSWRPSSSDPTTGGWDAPGLRACTFPGEGGSPGEPSAG